MKNYQQLLELFFSGKATEAQKEMIENLRNSDPDFAADFETEEILRSVQQNMRQEHIRKIISEAWHNNQEDFPSGSQRPSYRLLKQPLRAAGFALLALALIGGGYGLFCKHTGASGSTPVTAPVIVPTETPAPPTTEPIATTNEEPEPVQKPIKAPKKMRPSKPVKSTTKVAGLWELIQPQIPGYAVVQTRFSDYTSTLRGNKRPTTETANPDSLVISAALLAYEKSDYRQVKALLDNYSGANQRRVGYLRALACLQIQDWTCAKESADIAAISTMYKAEANWLKLLAELGSGKDVRPELQLLVEKQSPYATHAQELLSHLNQK